VPVLAHGHGVPSRTAPCLLERVLGVLAEHLLVVVEDGQTVLEKCLEPPHSRVVGHQPIGAVTVSRHCEPVEPHGPLACHGAHGPAEAVVTDPVLEINPDRRIETAIARQGRGCA